jgi:enoyl-CoA hydratase/carnithine racemase
MILQGLDIIHDLESDPTVRVIIMRGAGTKAFVSGGDISKFQSTRFDSNSGVDHRQKPEEFRSRIENCRKPVIAMINGYCLGGGLSIALCADMRFAADTCQLGIPSAQRGLVYALEGIARLVNVVGRSFALDMLVSARRVRHEEALRMGLVNRVFKADDLERETIAYAQTIAANAPLSVRGAKYFVNQLKLDKGARDEEGMKRMEREADESEDFKEATRAFMEKRRPVFQGA